MEFESGSKHKDLNFKAWMEFDQFANRVLEAFVKEFGVYVLHL